MLGYVGLGIYEASVSGMPAYKSIAYLYPGLSIPAVEEGKVYHYPTVLNNVYASLFKHFFATVQASDKTSMDSVEAALNAAYAGSASTPRLRDSTLRSLR